MWCRAKTSARLESVFSPPDKLPICFHALRGGRTVKRMPSKGSLESTSSSSASPHRVMVWYTSFSLRWMSAKDSRNWARRCAFSDSSSRRYLLYSASTSSCSTLSFL